MGNDAITDENKGETIKMTRGKTLPKTVRLDMLNHISEMYLNGVSYRQMAKRIEELFNRTISIVTIGNMVGSLMDEWKEQRVNNMENLKTVELIKINRLENTYWEGWLRSLDGKERKMDKQRAIPGTTVEESTGKVLKIMQPVSAEKSSLTQETFGDPRFLDGVQWCIEMRCKILGIKAPTEVTITSTTRMKTTTKFMTRPRNRPPQI